MKVGSQLNKGKILILKAKFIMDVFWFAYWPAVIEEGSGVRLSFIIHTHTHQMKVVKHSRGKLLFFHDAQTCRK